MVTHEEVFEVLLSKPQEVLIYTRANRVLDMAGQGSGKSQNIGYHTGFLITNFPRIPGFIGANTYDQLSGATLKKCFEVWRTVYGLTLYDKLENPMGSFVYDRKPPSHFQQFVKLKSYKNVICFYNGCIVVLGSLENYTAQDGKEFGWAHLDETKDTKEVAVKEVITGRLRFRGLWYDQSGELVENLNITNEESIAMGLKPWNPLFIHTSPAHGVVTWLNDWFKLSDYKLEIKEKVLRKELDFFHKEDEEAQTCAVIYSAYHNKDNLPPGKLEAQEASLGPELALKLVYGYPFGKMGGLYFPPWNELTHVREALYLPGLSIRQSWDFNVVPYMTCLLSQVTFIMKYTDGKGVISSSPVYGFTPFEVMQIRIFKEYCLEDPFNSTEAICDRYKLDFPPGTDTFYHGDASGLSRIPGLGYSNFSIIEEQLWQYFHNDSQVVKAPNVSPFTRRDLLNKILRGGHPNVELIVDPSCEKVIKDMNECLLGAKGKVKKHIEDEITGEKYEEVGHTSDALEYLVTDLCKHLIK